ncbi:MAG: peptidase S41, partial [Bacteroidetes bacterium QH_2_63_10]
MFDERPRPGATVEKPVGRGLSAQVPPALYSRDGRTLRPDAAPPAEPMQARLDSLALPHSGTALFAANVVVAWNVFQHFYPYFDVVDVDWTDVLGRSLRRALVDRSEDEFRRTLQRLVAQLQDGHGRVSPSPVLSSEWPFLLERAEGEVIVADTAS